MKKVRNEQMKTIRDCYHEMKNLNDEIKDVVNELNLLIQQFNANVTTIEEEMENVCDSIHNHFYSQSLNWQTSPSGKSYEEWMDQWVNAKSMLEYIDEVELRTKEVINDFDPDLLSIQPER